MKEKLLQLYIDALEDATGFYCSDYSSSIEDDEKRRQEDQELIQYSKSILEQL